MPANLQIYSIGIISQYTPVRISLVLGTEHRQEKTEEQTDGTKTTQRNNYNRRHNEVSPKDTGWHRGTYKKGSFMLNIHVLTYGHIFSQ